jgi:hypothetical protein
MADRKITELANITGADLADGDEFVVVDASADETKAITFGELKSGLDTATGFVRITGDTMTGALDVQSTITADGLTVDGTASIDGASGIPLTLDVDAGANTNLQFNEGSALRWYLRSVTGSNDFNFYGNGASRLNISSGGDISFFDDSGTAKLFWDASAERLGLGTAAPVSKIDIVHTGNTRMLFSEEATDTSTLSAVNTANSAYSDLNVYANNLKLSTNGSERMRIDSSGNVGIGTSSVNKSSSSTALTVNTGAAANYSALELSSGDTLNWHINANNGNVYDVTAGTRNRIFYTNGSERMRIDSSGNVGIGTSSPATPLDVTKAGGGNFVATFQNTTSATPYGVHIKDAASGANGYPLLQVTNSAGSSPYLLVHSGTGNVGIGTSSPTRPFSVVATGNTSSVFERTDGNYVIEMKGNGTTAPAAFGMFTNDLTVLVNNTERMRIDSSGNVGIGTSSPSSLLDVDKSQNAETNIELTNTNVGSAAQVRTKYTTDGGLFTVGKVSDAHAYSGAAYLWNVDNTNMLFATNDTERMRIDSSGNVGIGTTSLTGKAHIYKSSVNSAIIGTSYSGHYFESQSDDATDGFEIYQKHGSNTTRNSFIINDNRTGSKSAAFLVRGDGNVGIGTTPSTVLHINDASDPILRLQRGGAAYSQFQSDSAGSLYISADAGDSGALSRMQFNVDGSERMRIDGSGRVLINRTTTAGYQLDVYGDVKIERAGTSATHVVFTMLLKLMQKQPYKN